MVPTRTLVALAALLLAFLAPPATAAGPTAPKTPALTGTVTISGAKTGYVPVTIARDARLGDPFHVSRRDSVKIEGGGRMAGFALVQDGRQGPVIVGGRSEFTVPYAQRQGEFIYDALNGPPQGDDSYLLPAGSYRLYLLTDGKPTKVTLRFGGLRGQSALTPKVRTTGTVQGGPPSLTTGSTGVQSRGFDTPVKGASLMLQIFGQRTSVHTETAYNNCLHLTKPSGQQAYLPGCVSSDGSVGGGVVILISDESVADELRAAYGIAYIPAGGHFGAGMSANGPNVVQAADYSHFFLGLDA